MVSISQLLLKFYRGGETGQSLIDILFNPFFIARRALYQSMRRNRLFSKGDILDIGCGKKPYISLFDHNSYIGLEVIRENGASTADVFYNGSVLPFSNQQFDTVICSQVLEHVFEPDEFLNELGRTLKPGGKLLLSVPFVWEEHEKPYDYARYSSHGLHHLLSKNGFKVLTQEKLGTGASTLLQLIAAKLLELSTPLNRYLRLVIIVLFISPITLTGLIISKIFPSPGNLYLDNFLVAENLQDESQFC